MVNQSSIITTHLYILSEVYFSVLIKAYRLNTKLKTTGDQCYQNGFQQRKIISFGFKSNSLFSQDSRTCQAKAEAAKIRAAYAAEKLKLKLESANKDLEASAAEAEKKRRDAEIQFEKTRIERKNVLILHTQRLLAHPVQSQNATPHQWCTRIQFQSMHRNGKYNKWKNTFLRQNLMFSVSVK